MTFSGVSSTTGIVKFLIFPAKPKDVKVFKKSMFGVLFGHSAGCMCLQKKRPSEVINPVPPWSEISFVASDDNVFLLFFSFLKRVVTVAEGVNRSEGDRRWHKYLLDMD